MENPALFTQTALLDRIYRIFKIPKILVNPEHLVNPVKLVVIITIITAAKHTLRPATTFESDVINDHDHRTNRQNNEGDQQIETVRDVLFDPDRDYCRLLPPLLLSFNTQHISSRRHRRSVRRIALPAFGPRLAVFNT